MWTVQGLIVFLCPGQGLTGVQNGHYGLIACTSSFPPDRKSPSLMKIGFLSASSILADWENWSANSFLLEILCFEWFADCFLRNGLDTVTGHYTKRLKSYDNGEPCVPAPAVVSGTPTARLDERIRL